MVVEGDPEAQHALRFAIYHLIGAANPEDERVSIGARALTGRAPTRGTSSGTPRSSCCRSTRFTWPEAARALLHVPLPHAARRAGEGRAPGLPRRALRLGVGRHRRGGHAAFVRRRPTARSSRSSRASRSSTSAPTWPMRVWQYWQATADDDVPARGRAPRSSSRRRASGRAARELRGRRALPHPRGDRPGRVPRGRRRQRLHQRHGAVEPRARARRRPGSLAERWPERWAALAERARALSGRAPPTGGVARGWIHRVRREPG